LLLFILLFSAGVSARQVEVEDVTGRQLEAAEKTEDAIAVYWYSKNCKTCDRVLGVLERLGADVADAGITLLKINDKKSAKAHGVRNFPSLSIIRSGDISHYDGDMLDQEAVADFIVNTDDDDASQKFEHVSASELELLVTKNKYVAVFFYSGSKTSLHLDLRTDLHALAHQLDIRLACINDLALVAEYSLGELPSLVYYRHTIPILYQGDINAEDDILEWLVLNRQSGSDEDSLEEVDGAALKAIISAVENIAVLFYDSNSARSESVLEGLDSIDDDCSTKGIHFVKIASKEANSQFKVSTLPTLVFFQGTKPSFFEGNLNEETEVLEWLMAEADNSGIDEASFSVLERIIRETRHVVVVFCKYIAYAVIALTHTCYIIKNYVPDEFRKYLPPKSVKGLAVET